MLNLKLKIKLSSIISIFLLVFIAACSLQGHAKEPLYAIYMTNSGKNGIIINSMSYKKSGDLSLKELNESAVAALYPDFFGGHPVDSFGQFRGFKRTLPDTVEVVWQLAKLTGCDKVEHYSKYPTRVSKSGCTWHPIKGKVFRKQIDMTAIRNSDAYRQTGLPANKGSYLYGTKTLDIDLIFNEDHLTVNTRNSQTMGLGQ